MIRVAGDPVERKTVTKVAAKPARVTKVKGRPKVHETGADRQRAYRKRKGAR